VWLGGQQHEAQLAHLLGVVQFSQEASEHSQVAQTALNGIRPS